MQTIEISFEGSVTKEEVHRVLAAPESGFEIIDTTDGYDLRQPTRSTIGDVAAVVGTVLSAIQLGIAIYALIHSKPDAQSSSYREVKAYIHTPEYEVEVSEKSVTEIQTILEPHQAG